jgi:hypothetical protein
VRLTWSFLHAVADMWSSHPGTYRVVDEADDLVPAFAQMCMRAFASDVRNLPQSGAQALSIRGELTNRSGGVSEVTVRQVANKFVHGNPERIVVQDDGDIRVYVVPHENERTRESWTELWFSAPAFIDALYHLLYVKPEDSPRRNSSVRAFIAGLGSDRFLPTCLADDAEGSSSV